MKGEYKVHIYTVVRTDEKTIYRPVRSSGRPFWRSSKSLSRLWKCIDSMVTDYEQQYGMMSITPGIKRDLKAAMVKRSAFVVGHSHPHEHIIRISFEERT